ncbi:hypothetical protein [Algisphaera agarilytica]|uniref:Uncharacterized protein n=1 Tax=Algisphaera agarilytica TaxID=1385975 RepID=A0A7X0H3X4_9BACT|nr:hypothetical protein [Algisphaera agarilytica]MBB6428832.1 hypothetical protein [Algisphaera agarilytica]
MPDVARHLQACVWVSVVVALCTVSFSATGQTLQERIEDRERKLARAAERERANDPDLQIDRRMASRMDFSARGVGVKQALADWSKKTQVPLVIDWEAMEIDGVDPDLEVDIELEDVRADTVLLVLMDSMSEELRFIAETHGWGVHLRSRIRANQDVITRVYDVRDLLVDVPNFDDAPRLSLTDALSNTSSGGGSSPSGIFDVEEFSEEDRPLTKRERGELLVQLVRDTIEPDIWLEHGGEFSRARYSNGQMIVRAPLYVHVQIGRPAIALDR